MLCTLLVAHNRDSIACVLVTISATSFHNDSHSEQLLNSMWLKAVQCSQVKQFFSLDFNDGLLLVGLTVIPDRVSNTNKPINDILYAIGGGTVV